MGRGQPGAVVVGRESGGVQQMRYVQVDGSTPVGAAPSALTGVKEVAASEDEQLPWWRTRRRTGSCGCPPGSSGRRSSRTARHRFIPGGSRSFFRVRTRRACLFGQARLDAGGSGCRTGGSGGARPAGPWPCRLQLGPASTPTGAVGAMEISTGNAGMWRRRARVRAVVVRRWRGAPDLVLQASAEVAEGLARCSARSAVPPSSGAAPRGCDRIPEPPGLPVVRAAAPCGRGARDAPRSQGTGGH